jgi:hypothetical protein
MERPMSYRLETEESQENLDHSFEYNRVSVDILECPLDYKLESWEQLVPMIHHLHRVSDGALNP